MRVRSASLQRQAACAAVSELPRQLAGRCGSISKRLALKPVCFRDNDRQESVENKVAQRVDRATAAVAHTMSGFLSSPDTQAHAYWALGATALCTALACLALPGQFAAWLLGGPTDRVVDSMVRAAGATLLTSATVKFTLKEAAVRGQLHMNTFRRLNIGLVLQCTASLVLTAQAISLRNPLLTGYMSLVCGSGLLLAARVYYLTKQAGGLPLPSLKRTLSAVIGVLLPRTPASTAYSLLTLAFAGMTALCWGTAPGGALRLYDGIHGPMTVFAQRAAGAGMMLMTICAYSLKDGADRQKLGATTFRWLNLGLAGSMLAMIWHLTCDYEAGLLVHNAKSLGMMAAIVSAFMWTGYQYIAGVSAPKPAPA